MGIILFLLLVMLALALAAAIGTYHLSHNQLMKVQNQNAKIISLFLSLCSFGAVIVIIYFILLYNVRIER